MNKYYADAELLVVDKKLFVDALFCQHQYRFELMNLIENPQLSDDSKLALRSHLKATDMTLDVMEKCLAVAITADKERREMRTDQ
jgi:CRP-like cAMP-binding protein